MSVFFERLLRLMLKWILPSSGHPIATVLNGFVDRKVIKQTVMTTVYGVTPYGAKLQIARQLKVFLKY